MCDKSEIENLKFIAAFINILLDNIHINGIHIAKLKFFHERNIIIKRG